MKRIQRTEHQQKQAENNNGDDEGSDGAGGVRSRRVLRIYRQTDTGTDLRVFRNVLFLRFANGYCSSVGSQTQLKLPRCKVKFIWANPCYSTCITTTILLLALWVSLLPLPPFLSHNIYFTTHQYLVTDKIANEMEK